ncbi:MAG: immunity 49 family protein [Myxococcales bacterium]|nr:immunity 49 family protein [Myxococcales bacterium]MCB9580301.1 immunity 49 family protein [Polyangiaceae bacterium]
MTDSGDRKHHYYDYYGDRSEAEADVARTSRSCAKIARDEEPHRHLDSLASIAESWAWWLTPLGDRKLRRALDLWGEALVGHFRMACAEPGDQLTVTLGGKPVAAIGKGPDSTSHAGRWGDAFLICAISRNHRGLDELCRVPEAVFGGSVVNGRERFSTDEWVVHLARALRAMWTRSEQAGDHLVAALEATDPGRTNFGEFESRVLDLEVPLMELMLRLLERDERAFNEAYDKALGLHRRYFTIPERLHDPEGFLAIRPLSMACLAHDIGMHIERDSPYAPLWLIQEAEE